MVALTLRVAMPCGGGLCSPGGAYGSVWDSVMPMTGIFLQLFPVPGGRGCVCMLNAGSAAMTLFMLTITTIPGSS